MRDRVSEASGVGLPRPESHAALRSSIAAAALDAADPVEEARVEAHVHHCASCQELARRLAQAAAAMAFSVEEVEPPPRLRDRILKAGRTSSPRQPTLRSRLRGDPGAAGGG